MTHSFDINSKIDIKSLTESEKKSLELLLNCDQHQIFSNWKKGENLERKKAFLNQVSKLDKVCIGGLKIYISKCKELLEKSKKNENPFKGMKPSVPNGRKLMFDTIEFDKAESEGFKALPFTAFVLVAGGLGERLGYPGIKLELTCELTTGTCFIGLYAEYLLAYQSRIRTDTEHKNHLVPLAIMTSDDTHDKTLDLFNKNSYFGMDKEQVTFLKQEKVPSVINNNGDLAMTNDYELCTKPHGHGDVHALLLNSVLETWARLGVRHIVFFQDTNILAFKGVPALLGCSSMHELEVNFLVVPRRRKEAVGSICRLADEKGNTVTCNVEYNQFESLLNANNLADVEDENGFSPYPGNTNVFVVELKSYSETLKKTHGRIPEFINPKYADETKTSFKSAARIECMMQDYSKQLPGDSRVAYTQLERWLCYSSAKNNTHDAVAKQKATGFAESAASAEADFYFANKTYLRHAGAKIVGTPRRRIFDELSIEDGAHVVIKPSFGVTFSEIKSKLSPAATLTEESTLVVDGRGLLIKNLDVDGCLVLKTSSDSVQAEVANMKVRNKGWHFKALTELGTSQLDKNLRVRGYWLDKNESEEKQLTENTVVNE